MSAVLKTGRYLALFLLVCFFLMPVYALLVTALKDPASVSVVRMWELPSSFSLENFRIVWPDLQEGFGALFRCFRLTVFVSTLWLLTRWWDGGFSFVRYHIRTYAVSWPPSASPYEPIPRKKAPASSHVKVNLLR